MCDIKVYVIEDNADLTKLPDKGVSKKLGNIHNPKDVDVEFLKKISESTIHHKYRIINTKDSNKLQDLAQLLNVDVTLEFISIFLSDKIVALELCEDMITTYKLRSEKSSLIMTDKRDLEQLLYSLKREVDLVKERKEVHILGSEYSNGVYLQSFQLGYEEQLNFMEMLVKRYEQEIATLDKLSLYIGGNENESKS